MSNIHLGLQVAALAALAANDPAADLLVNGTNDASDESLEATGFKRTNGHAPKIPNEPPPPTFREFHNDLRKQSRQYRLTTAAKTNRRNCVCSDCKDARRKGLEPRHSVPAQIISRPGQLRGKAALKAAKRERVKAFKVLKAAANAAKGVNSGTRKASIDF